MLQAVGQAILPAAAFQAALWLRLCCLVGQAVRLPSLASRAADAASLAWQRQPNCMLHPRNTFPYFRKGVRSLAAIGAKGT